MRRCRNTSILGGIIETPPVRATAGSAVRTDGSYERSRYSSPIAAERGATICTGYATPAGPEASSLGTAAISSSETRAGVVPSKSSPLANVRNCSRVASGVARKNPRVTSRVWT
jgi:hypothetical protein